MSYFKQLATGLALISVSLASTASAEDAAPSLPEMPSLYRSNPANPSAPGSTDSASALSNLQTRNLLLNTPQNKKKEKGKDDSNWLVQGVMEKKGLSKPSSDDSASSDKNNSKSDQKDDEWLKQGIEARKNSLKDARENNENERAKDPLEVSSKEKNSDPKEAESNNYKPTLASSAWDPLPSQSDFRPDISNKATSFKPEDFIAPDLKIELPSESFSKSIAPAAEIKAPTPASMPTFSLRPEAGISHSLSPTPSSNLQYIGSISSIRQHDSFSQPDLRPAVPVNPVIRRNPLDTPPPIERDMNSGSRKYVPDPLEFSRFD